MNVTVLSTSSRKAGGLFYSVRWLSKALASPDCQLKLLSPIDEYSEEDLGVWEPLSVELYPTFGPINTSFKLRKRLAESGADLIHLHGIWMDNQWAALQHQKKNGTAVVVSPRGMLDPWALKNAAWKKNLAGKLFAREALEKASCIHSLCKSETESIRALGLKTPVAQIPNGVEVPELGERKKEDRAQKEILFLGRIHPKKGLKELLHAWSNVSGNWKLLIAGWDDGGHEDGLKTLAQELKISDSVEFIGSQYGEEKQQLLQRVDAFILPSFSEGLPMSVLEAWSYELPVVMTDFCNIPEGFEADAAVRVEPEAESIAKGLEQFTAMPYDELIAMGLRGRKLVEQKFTWSKIAEEMAQVYAWCLNGGTPPDCMEL